jgi:hypothetical protein
MGDIMNKALAIQNVDSSAYERQIRVLAKDLDVEENELKAIAEELQNTSE